MSVCKAFFNTKPNRTVVTLNISEPELEAYTTGDTISGCVTLEVAERNVPLTQVLVNLKCIETCKVKGFEQQSHTHFSRNINISQSPTGDMDGLILSRGKHVFPFKFLLSEETSDMPPTTSLDDMGAPDSGFRWLMTGCVYLGNRCSKAIKHLEDTLHVPVHPTVLKKLDCYGINVEDAADADENNPFNLKITAPRYLPRSPETFSIEVGIEAPDPIYIGSISATLETIGRLRVPTTSQNPHITEVKSSYLLSKVSYCKLFAGKHTLDGFLANCRLDNFGMTSYSSVFVEVISMLVIEIVGCVHDTSLWLVDVMPLWYSLEAKKKAATDRIECRKLSE